MGMNARLDTIQAAVLLSKLEIFDWEIKERNRIAKIYSEELSSSFQIPEIPNDSTSVWAQYTIQSSNRDEVIGFLKDNNIPAMIYYPKPMHEQPAYKAFSLNKDLSVSTNLSKNVFSIPIHPYLTDLEVEYIIETLKKANNLLL